MESQTKQILNHMKSGREITPLSALNLYGCFRLGARIYDLRKENNIIHSRRITEGKKTYASYYIK